MPKPARNTIKRGKIRPGDQAKSSIPRPAVSIHKTITILRFRCACKKFNLKAPAKAPRAMELSSAPRYQAGMSLPIFAKRGSTTDRGERARLTSISDMQIQNKTLILKIILKPSKSSFFQWENEWREEELFFLWGTVLAWIWPELMAAARKDAASIKNAPR